MNEAGWFPSFKVVDTRLKKRRYGITYSLSPELCAFSNHVQTPNKNEESKLFGFAEFFIEVKNRSSEDIFEDPDAETDRSRHNFTPYNEQNRASLGRIASYAAEICAHQHRTHCFSISIYGPYARLIRWDRSGVIVSERFKFIENSEWLCLFFWRYSHATDSQRGFDMTIGSASDEEEKIFEGVVRAHVKEQRQLEDGNELDAAVKRHYEKGRVFKMPIEAQVPKRFLAKSKQQKAPDDPQKLCSKPSSGSITALSGEDGKYNINQEDSPMKGVWTSDKQYFLVSRPAASPDSVTGGATRGYWAVKLPSVGSDVTADAQVAFVKDTWRALVNGMYKEGVVYMELLDAGVPNVSDIFCQGDVPNPGGEIQERAKTEGSVSKAANDQTKCALFVVPVVSVLLVVLTAKLDQETLTDEYTDAKWVCNSGRKLKIIPQRHYRLALVEVGYPLSDLKGTQELLCGPFDAFEGASL